MALSNAHVQAALDQQGGPAPPDMDTWQHTPGGSLPDMPTGPGIIPMEFSGPYWSNQERASNWLQGLNNMPGVLDPMSLTDPTNNFTANTPWQNQQFLYTPWMGLLESLIKKFNLPPDIFNSIIKAPP